MSYIRSGDSEHPTWSGDYILTEGDFIVKYKIPKIVQGSYNMFIHALGYGSGNAVIEVYVDGVKIGGVLDLSNINTWGWSGIEVGSIDFSIYEHHTVEIRSLIPGRLEWDNVSFEPI
jgi:hypothetical protein